MKTIVVLGAGLGAAPLIRQLMRTQVLKRDDLKLVVVAPNTHFHWTVATPRLVVPDQLRDDQVMIDLEPIFSQYPPDKFERLLGKATGVDAAAKTVAAKLHDGGEQTVPYDVLVVATGTTSADGMPWKVVDDTSRTRERLHELQEQIRSAQRIVVAGGGLTGTETAGELGCEYAQNGDKEVYFVYAEALPLSPTELASARETAAAELKRLKVKLMPNTTVAKATTTGRETMLELCNADGSTQTLTAQAYVPALGMRPNTSFLPADMLDGKDLVRQTQTLQVEGHPDIFVVGDAGNLQAARAQNTEAQMLHAVKALPAFLESGTAPTYRPGTMKAFAASLGPSKGTGEVNGWRMPGWMVWWAKSRSLGTNIAPLHAAGKRSLMKKYE